MAITPLSVSSSFAALTAQLRREIETALEAYTRYGPGCPPTLQAAIRHSLLGPGKRLRPMLVLMAAEACGWDRQPALPAACAVEMVHTYSLIHDDLPAMDDDDLRRGLPTCHAKFGETTAILAGDALLAQAFEVLGRDVRPESAAARCWLVGGQADDLAAEFGEGQMDELEAIHRRKTGALFTAALRLGGHVAGADERCLAALSRYGESLGLAFQIVDDLLDLKGTAADLGKRTQKDAPRGKLTFPGLLGVDASRERAERLIDDARQSLEILKPHASGLEGLARFVLQRTQ
jgi:geranylgeranyl diphosphate synthase, type II